VHVWERERERERRPFPDGSRPAKLAAVLGAVARRVGLLRRESIELLHLNNSPYLGYDDWLPAGRFARAACLANAVGKPYEVPPPGLRRRLVTGYDRIVSISSHITTQLEAGGFPRARLRTIVPGIDVADFAARVKREPSAVRRELGVEEGEVLALMVGNLRSWKGQDRVLEALRRLPPARVERLKLAFAGAARPEDADYVGTLEQTLRESGLARRVAFLGARKDVPDLVNAADLVLHASVFPEPFGLVVVEGLALGKPVLAARRGGPIEILGDEVGFLHDPDDPSELAAILARLIEQPELRAAAAKPARARAAEFDARRGAERVQDLYDEVLAERRGARGSSPVGGR
jgi:glycosyltransferase involved in cell wall biosynthesis